ncbi:unnamed protein product, partial [Iphiclides podalirius]
MWQMNAIDKCCSQCSFKAQFESALAMHRQLHHDANDDALIKLKTKSSTIPFVRKKERPPPSACSEKNVYNLSGRTSSATRLFDKLRTRICRSRTLFAHPEERADTFVQRNLSPESGRTSKISKLESTTSSCNTAIISSNARREIYSCHLCTFDADRITVLDRHLLNDHKISLENLLKLVMAKTKDGLSDDHLIIDEFGIRQPYYKPTDDIIEEGEFLVETVTPKIKILKHAGVNTDLKWNDIPEFKTNCRMIKKELEKLIESPGEENQRDELLVKMQSLNDCMCKFVDSSNTLKKVLTKGFDSKNSLRTEQSIEPVFDLGLGDQETPREWERPHSEKLERIKCKYGETRYGLC